MYKILLIAVLVGSSVCSITGSSRNTLGSSTSSHDSYHSKSLASSRISSVHCVDKISDCTQETCRNFPFTAHERCAKTCGLCDDQPTSSGGHSSSFTVPIRQTGLPSDRSTAPCVDKDTDCTQDTCTNYPYTAKNRCAKTCGLCDVASTSSAHSHSSSSSSSLFDHEMSSRRTSSGVIRDGSTSSSSHARGSGGHSIIGKVCVDKDSDCTAQTCRDYPFTAKERCAKTCNHCADGSGATAASSTHSSIRSHHSAHGTDAPAHSVLSKAKDLDCVDLDIDCTRKTCDDYPYTAKQRCAKTCGFCEKEASDRGTHEHSSSRHSSIGGDSTHRQHSHGSIHDASSRRTSATDSIGGTPASSSTHRTGSIHSTHDDSTNDCADKQSNCDSTICMERPHTARSKCAKTCGFCGDDSRGSLIGLRTDSIDQTERDSVITLDDDDRDTRRHGTDHGPSSSSSSRKQSSSSSSHRISTGDSISSTSSHHASSIGTGRHSSHSKTADFTTAPPMTHTTRTRTRTGPCVDQNRHCEKADCNKYPRFAERYCEQTCGFC